MKLKNIKYLILLIICSFSFMTNTLASDKVIITEDQVRFRSKPTIYENNIITELYRDNELELISDSENNKGNGCSDIWYYASFNGNKGYVCSSFATIKKEVNIDSSEYIDYQEYLSKLGFPESYFDYLISLHEKYPNWQFKVFNVGITFDEMVNYEYKDNGLSLIEDMNREIDGYKSLDTWSYNFLNDTFYTGFYGGGWNWYAANKTVIGYYLDPRNFLNEKQIFMFETLGFNPSYHTIDGINNMLKGTFMYDTLSDTENEISYAKGFLDAAEKYKISPYLLISRVIQEVGAQGSTIVSGTVTNYEGYYNFYNIEAAGETKDETIRNGLEYAKKVEWTTPYKSIVGGASFLVKGYIQNGQDSLYLQKWDLYGPLYGNHQYMQNIQAPASESIKTYNGYNSLGLVDSAFVFTIPVFKNMPDKTTLPNSSNPNNYLKNLSVNGSYLFESASNETEYNLNLSSETSSVEINVTRVSEKSSVSGVGSISLKGESQVIPITVTAENGDVRIYNINVTRDIKKELAISEILNLSNIKNDGKFIFGIKPETNIDTVTNLMREKEERVEISYKSRKNKNEGIIGTGDKITIKTSNEEKEYTFIIYGDVNGDGKITSLDYILIKNHIMEVSRFSEEELIYGDANKDLKVTSADYIAIKNHIMSNKLIEQ